MRAGARATSPTFLRLFLRLYTELSLPRGCRETPASRPLFSVSVIPSLSLARAEVSATTALPSREPVEGETRRARLQGGASVDFSGIASVLVHGYMLRLSAMEMAARW